MYTKAGILYSSSLGGWDVSNINPKFVKNKIVYEIMAPASLCLKLKRIDSEKMNIVNNCPIGKKI